MIGDIKTKEDKYKSVRKMRKITVGVICVLLLLVMFVGIKGEGNGTNAMLISATMISVCWH
ncbi:MAG: hypothetical protein ABIB71_06960 [Candidatus Woesearchaeota archaeon]